MRVRTTSWALVCIACWPALSTAAVEPTDTIQIQATVGFAHDNNLFRLPDADPTLFGINPDNKSDTAFIKGVGIKFDTLVSRQRLMADFNISETTYDNNSNLDHSGHEGRLAWLWRIGNDWDGEASYRKRRALGGFADQFLKDKDLIDTEYYRFTGGYQLDARWRVGAEFNKEDQSHSAFNQRSLDFDAKTAGVGITYRTPADNSIGLHARRTDRDYPNRVTQGPLFFDNNHEEDRINVIGVWRATGLLRLEAQFGHVDVNHDQLATRDFSSYTWRGGGIWDATGKFRLTLNAFKDARLYEDIASSYIIVHGVNVTPVYAITSKVSLQGDFVYEKRDFRGNPGFVLGLNEREDTFRLARLALTYAPLRNVDLSLSFETGDRRSNVVVNSISVNSYDYQAWFGTARISF